ncbi:MAG TPA: hypothetical protein VGL02_12350 [Streptomyces sp.]
MSIADKARQLIALADQAPSAEVAQLQQSVTEWNAAVQGLLGDSTASLVINSIVGQVLKTCGELQKAIEIVKKEARDAGKGHLGG